MSEAVLAALEAVSEHPFNYDAHAACIKTLREVQSVDELRAARESMHSLFPLSQDLWIEWLDDELASFNATDALDTSLRAERGMAVIDLFNQAVQDYLSIPIWIKFVLFVRDAVFPPDDDSSDDEEHEGEASAKPQARAGWLSVADAREVFRSANQATGLHFSESHKVWNVWRDFELRVLKDLKAAKASRDVLNRAVGEVRAIFLARLAIPHSDIDETFAAYSPFETTYDNFEYEARMKHASSVRAKSKKECADRETSELKLSAAGYSLRAFRDQLDFWSKRKGADPMHLRTLWERCISSHFLEESAWEGYLIFLMTRMRVQPVVIGVADRAIRNCSWSGELWGHRLRVGELFEEPEDELDDVFNRACAFITEVKSSDQFVVLMKNRCGFARRKFLEQPSVENTQALRSVHKVGIQVFRDTFGGLEDFRLEQEHIHDEVHLFHDIQKARAIYDTLLLAHPQSASLVIAASMFERNHGRDVSKASWILNRAAPKQIGGNAAAVTNAYVLHGAIVSLAKDTGCLSDAEYYAALEKADAAARRSAAIAAAAQASAEKRSAAVVWDDADGSGGVSKKARVADDPMELDGPSAPVELPAQTPKVPAPKKKEFYVLNNSNAGSIIRLVDVKPDTDPVVFKSLFKTKMPPVDYFLISQEDGTTDGFIEFSRADDAINAALLETVKVFGKSVSIQRCIPPKEWSDFDEQEGAGNNNDIERKKIFVSNVDVQVDKPLLRSVFGQFGKLKEVRLVQRNTAAFAYLEYEIAKSAENSLQMNGRYLEGFPDRKLSVALADKTKTKKRVADPKELIITNFPPAMEKDEIIALFSKYGTVKDVRMLLDRSGFPRGVGFVEFVDEEGAKSALQLNGSDMNGKILAVAPSDPNIRGGVHASSPQPASVATRGAKASHAPEKRGSDKGKGTEGRNKKAEGNSKAPAPKNAAAQLLVPRAAGRRQPILQTAKAKTAATIGDSNKAQGQGELGQEQTGGGDGDGDGGKSQEDFRQMLLGGGRKT